MARERSSHKTLPFRINPLKKPFQSIYRGVYNNTLRPYLPKKLSMWNGVAVRDHAMLDITRDDVREDYEPALINAIRSTVRYGDRVVVVGGGWGVSTVVAARRTGLNGSVDVYEGSRNQLETILETLRINGVSDITSAHLAVVSNDASTYGNRVYGDGPSGPAIPVTDLPECDVLILDCEGAEIPIIKELAIEPDAIIAETHGWLGAPEKDLRDYLNEQNYTITNRGVENEKNGIYILTAMRTDKIAKKRQP